MGTYMCGMCPHLPLTTSPRLIEADVALYSFSGMGGVFDIHSGTINSPLTLNIHTAPVDSRLDVVAITTLSDVRVSLPAAYEGAFELETSLARAAVEVDNRVSDPAGDGRRRKIVHRSRSGNHAMGAVGWTPSRPNSQQGQVQLTTAIGKAYLKL